MDMLTLSWGVEMPCRLTAMTMHGGCIGWLGAWHWASGYEEVGNTKTCA
jgi:hypothetical protein